MLGVWSLYYIYLQHSGEFYFLVHDDRSLISLPLYHKEDASSATYPGRNLHQFEKTLESNATSVKKTIVYYHFLDRTWGEFTVANSDDTLLEWWWVLPWVSLRPKARRCPLVLTAIATNASQVALEHPVLEKLYNKSHTTIKVLFQDWSDMGYGKDMHICVKKVAKFIGKENVYVTSRRLIRKRDLSCFSFSNSTCSASTPISTLNGTVWDYQSQKNSISAYIHNGVIAKNDFFVREDYYELLNNRLKELLGYTQGPTHEQFFVHTRSKDVAHFWDIEQHDKYGQFRNIVTKHVASFLRTYNLSGTAGLVSERSRNGRQNASDLYADAMLDHKIIVLAQRDQWEDHFRLLEGLMSGAMIISDPITFLPAGLKENESIVFYNSLEELDRKLLYYLTNEVGRKERVAIAKEGRRVAVEYHREPDVYRRMMLPGNWPTDWRSPVVQIITPRLVDYMR